ncbi:MAG: tetratricopeptide repeat protein, partial [Planctomycetaceae bacterium]|nr:tetratricopeptide repeat protein [Planctomycetaceae bacterium]
MGDFTSSARLLRDAKLAMARGDLSRAENLALRLARRTGQNAAGNILAAEVATKLERPRDAIGYYEQVPDDGSPANIQALRAMGDLMLNTTYELSDAERSYQRILQHDPHELGAHYRIAYVLGLEGRSWEAVPHRLELIRGNRREPIQLVLLALGDTAEENFHLIEDYLRAAPDDPGALTARAWMHIRREELDAARKLLERATATEPTLMTSQAWLGRTLLERPASDFLKWNRALLPAADRHPEIWLARGRFALVRSQPRIAARCFWESVRLDPESTVANFQLGAVLASLGELKSAELFRRRSRLLQELTTAAKSFQFNNAPRNAETAARLAEELGLLWETWCWLQIWNELVPGRPQLVAKIQKVRRQLDQLDPESLQRSTADANPANQVDLRSYPLPDWEGSDNVAGTAKRAESPEAAIVTFSEHAAAAGIRFQFRNGSQPDSVGDYMYEMSGGGVGVLDFNSDGWPDLYLTQGADWPPRPDQNGYLDKLYLNLGNGHFKEVSQAARIYENGFSQGPTVGDIDQDGFSDLYVSNIGPNRMFHNNGDGTFTELTAETGTAGDRWTVSSVIADFNGDALPDLYNVNYLTGEGLFDRPCGIKAGTNRTGCSPHEFAAAQDQLFLNLGDGRFAERTDEAGIVVPNGKGMGVVAADFDGSGKLSLFVGNDAVPNFLFVNETSQPGAEPRFQERGYASGLAVDADGRAQACMGIAAGDANGDGLVDLFVTNFRAESNTLYLNQSQMSFVDETRRAGLRDASFDMLGFGSQFLDGELDGLPDLVVANGHIANLKSIGIEYEMRPQYFRNLGEARFTELRVEVLGPYFQGKWLGRGLARWDWNRDGKEDFVVSHLATQAALVTNETR